MVYGINSKYVGLVIHSQRDFAQTPFSKGLSGNMASAHATTGVASTVDARYSIITTYGNMTIRNRRRHFKLDGTSRRLREPVPQGGERAPLAPPWGSTHQIAEGYP